MPGASPDSGGLTLASRSVGFLALTLFLGILVGSVLGQAIGLFVAEGSVAYQLFVDYVGFGPKQVTLDLVALELMLGITVRVNLMSVIGVFLVAQLLRWIR